MASQANDETSERYSCRRRAVSDGVGGEMEISGNHMWVSLTQRREHKSAIPQPWLRYPPEAIQ